MRHGLFATLATFTLVVAGCSRTTGPVAPPAERAPEPNSPQNVLRSFEWAIAHRDLAAIAELITADFVFVTAGTDSWDEVSQRREDLLEWFRELLVGTPEHPPAATISFHFDDELVPHRNPDPGRPDSLFQAVRTSLELEVVWQDGTMEVTSGHALFSLGRGDVVAIPDDLRARGVSPDPGRWWMTRWEDETIAPEARMTGETSRATPSAPTTEVVWP